MVKLKYLFMTMLVALVSMAMVSCGDDDDDDTVGIYNIETSVRGGGYDGTTLAQIEQKFDDMIDDLKLYGVTEKTAKKAFDMFADKARGVFKNGVANLKEPLYITFTLKSSDDKTIKSATLKVTKTGCE